jgi:hypothetical protein
MVNLMKNVQDFGPVVGLGRTVGNKLSPFVRTGVQLLTNTNYLGQSIAVRGANIGTNIKRTAARVASQTLPVPFSASNIEQMLTDPKNEYSPEEYVTTLLGGTRSRNVPPESVRRAMQMRAESRAKVKRDTIPRRRSS